MFIIRASLESGYVSVAIDVMRKAIVLKGHLNKLIFLHSMYISNVVRILGDDIISCNEAYVELRSKLRDGLNCRDRDCWRTFSSLLDNNQIDNDVPIVPLLDYNVLED